MRNKFSEFKKRCLLNGESLFKLRYVYEDACGATYVMVNGERVDVIEDRRGDFRQVGSKSLSLFDNANNALRGDGKDYNRAWEEFGLEFRGSVCDLCARRPECNAKECDDEQGCIIEHCNFFSKIKHFYD